MNKKKGVSYAKWGYIFALPFCIAYLLFMIYPIFNTFTIGFTNMTDKLQMQIAQEELSGGASCPECMTFLTNDQLEAGTCSNCGCEVQPAKIELVTENQSVLNIPVAEGEVTPGTEYIYIPAKTLKDKGKYLIVGENVENGKQVAFLNNSGKEEYVEVDQRDVDFTFEDFVYTGEMIELNKKEAVWTASGNDSEGYVLSNGGYYLGGDRNTLTKDAVQGKNNKVIYDTDAGRLKTVSEDTKYLYYSTYATSFGEEYWTWSPNEKTSEYGSRQMWIFEQVPVMKEIEVQNPFANYKTVLKDQNFWKSLANTCIIWSVNFVPQILLALLLAVWFTNTRNNIRGKGFFKVLFYMPNIITAATIAMLFTKLFDYNKGPVNDLLKMLGVIEENINFFAMEGPSRAIVAFVQFWMWYGYTMIILISGILGISPELFEAADIDGANGWQKFVYVTLPNLKSIMLFTLVTSMIGGMTMFDIPFMVGGQGAIKGNIRTLSVYIFEMSFQGGKLYNIASAASMLVFVLIAVLAAVIFFMLRDKDEAKQHKIEKMQTKAFKKALKEQNAKGGEN